MIDAFLTHWKAGALLTSVATGIGLMANQFTAPKMLAVMVFLADWNMLWTWEWWTRMIIFITISVAVWWIQKRKHARKLSESEAAWREQIVSLQGEIRHSQLMLTAAQTRIAILEGRKK